MFAASLYPPENTAAMSKKKAAPKHGRTTRLNAQLLHSAGVVARHFDVRMNRMLSVLLSDRVLALHKAMMEEMNGQCPPRSFAAVLQERLDLAWSDADAAGDEDDDEDKGPAAAARTPKPGK